MDFIAKQGRVRVLRTAYMLFSMLAWTGSAMAQQKERTLDKIKTEAIKRAENGMYPLIGLDPADVCEAFASIKPSDYDEWAAGFTAVADRYMEQARAAETTDSAKASALHVKAWRPCPFARWPAPASAGQQRPDAQSLRAFLPHCRLM